MHPAKRFGRRNVHPQECPSALGMKARNQRFGFKGHGAYHKAASPRGLGKNRL